MFRSASSSVARQLLRCQQTVRMLLLLLLPGNGGCCSCCVHERWKCRLAARVRVHGGAGRAARAPPLDGGTVAYVDGSVAATGAMGAGIFYGIAHPLNRSVRLLQWWSNADSTVQRHEAVGDPNLAELGAVYLALLFHPPDQPLTLCTDSLFVLQQLQWLTTQQVRAESLVCSRCNCLLHKPSR
jgi:hypothetical protein